MVTRTALHLEANITKGWTADSMSSIEPESVSWAELRTMETFTFIYKVDVAIWNILMINYSTAWTIIFTFISSRLSEE